jgi:hypothetical protein
LSFSSKKIYEKHRRTAEHKIEEKNTQDLKVEFAHTIELARGVETKRLELNELVSKGVNRTVINAKGYKIKGSCSLCNLEFLNHEHMMDH